MKERPEKAGGCLNKIRRAAKGLDVDVGYVKSSQPAHIKLKQGITMPYKTQYALKQHAIEGIKPTIECLLKAGVMVKTESPLNTHIKKPHSDYL